MSIRGIVEIVALWPAALLVWVVIDALTVGPWYEEGE